MLDTAGLTENEARELARQGCANTAVSGSSRTTARILRTTVFSSCNNILFVIGIALLALGAQAYLGLTAPDPPVIWVAAPAAVLWFVTLSLVLRSQALERALGLLRPAPETVPA